MMADFTSSIRIEVTSSEYSPVHLLPIWRDKADAIISAHAEDVAGIPVRELLEAKHLPNGNYLICCIPFFARNLALGDEVEVEYAPRPEPVVVRVALRSGHYAYRVWFGNLRSDDRPRIQRLVEAKLAELGCAHEWASANLVAIDADSYGSASDLAAWLDEQESLGSLQWEAANDAEG